MISSKPVRGTRDIKPDEMLVRDQLEQVILSTYRDHGFNRIETPVTENIDLLLGSEGGENLKMLFTILKRGNKFQPSEESTVRDLCDIGLRYDLTLPLSRFYANNEQALEMPFKAIQIGNVFRAERPQKGRYRSFKQCDIDIIGEASHVAEMELISTTSEALLAIGFKDFNIKINDRRLLTAFILKAGFKAEDIGSICISLDKIDKIGIDGVSQELVDKGNDVHQVHDFMDQISKITLDNLDTYIDLPEVTKNLKHIIEVSETLAKGRYRITFEFTLIRGMGYYTGTVFEVAYGEYASSIAGGGRYDHMIGKYSKSSVPAVGFSIGFERIVNILMEDGSAAIESAKNRTALFYHPQKDGMIRVFEMAESLRNKGHQVTLMIAKKKVGKQIQHCEEKGYTSFMIFGQDNELRVFNE